ncbi:MAG: methyltransferase [Desulfurococcaceae archaeon]
MHYYRPGKAPGRKVLIPFVIRGVTLQFVSYSSLFSGTEVDEGTRLLLENIVLPDSGLVLDVGCGYGIIGITIAKLNPSLKVYMVDVNPLAVKVSRINARLNDVENRVVVLEGDRYEPVKNTLFKAIYSNPPLSAGMKIVEDIVLGAREHLEKNGFAQFVLAKGGEYLLREARKLYSHVESTSKKGYILLYLRP